MTSLEITPPPKTWRWYVKQKKKEKEREKRRLGTAAQDPSPSSSTPGFTTEVDFIPFGFSDKTDGEQAKDVPFILGRNRERARAKRKGRPPIPGDDWVLNEKPKKVFTPWTSDVDWDSCLNLAEMLNQEVKAFVKYISPTPIEHEVRGMIVSWIAAAIQSKWPDARVSPFGSYETQLYLPLGDIDLVVETYAKAHIPKTRALQELASIVRKSALTDKVEIINSAKVPIIKFVTRLGQVSVDINVNQTSGLMGGHLVNRFMKELPALRPLIMVIKTFLSVRNMNEVYTGGLGSYAIVCMAISFLQMHPKIRGGEIDPCENLGVLVMEFFELYGYCFNYQNTGISLREGGMYFNKFARGWSEPNRPLLLSIEDPIDVSNDLSRGSFNIALVRKAMAGAYEVLTAVALTRSRVLMSKARGEYTSLRGPWPEDDQSLLGSVMGVSFETVAHRRRMIKLYQSNKLQSLLGLPPLPRDMTVFLAALQALNTPTPTQQQSREAVESAWGEANMDLESSDQELLHSRPRSPSTDEESRYTRKRRRIDPPMPSGTKSNPIFVEASEEEQFVPQDKQPSSSRVQYTDGSGQARDGRAETRRAYWASKGMFGGGSEGIE